MSDDSAMENSMKRNTGFRIIRSLTAGCLAVSVVFLIVLAVMFLKSGEDPRWRIFDYNSRQATVSEIYAVSEIPSVRSVQLTGKRRLRFLFNTDFKPQAWKVTTKADGAVVSEGVHPELPFPDEPYSDTFIFTPVGAQSPVPIEITVSFYPQEKYAEAGLSWPDNYYTPSSTVPFSLKPSWSIDDWAGIAVDDPDIREARRIIEPEIDLNAPQDIRSGQVFRFVMNAIKNSGGTPTDAVQNASPLETYRLLSSGEGKGFCENRALVYYLFANAAGIKTRLIDVAGKFGPLKLTGHYFCESWDESQMRWFLADPMSGVTRIKNTSGLLMSTLDIKHLFDTDMIGQCSAMYFNAQSGDLEERGIEQYDRGNRGYLKGDIVIAYRFGYPKNRSYPALRNFVSRPTLLYSPLELPRLYCIKVFCMYGLAVLLIVSIVLGIVSAVVTNKGVRSEV